MSELTTAGSTRTQNSSGPVREVPNDRPLPFFGRGLDVRRDLLGTLRSLCRQLGPVYRSHLFGLQQITLLGAEAQRVFFENRDGAFSARRGWSRFLDHVFPGSILAMDNPDHSIHRRVMQQAFARNALRGYATQMGECIDAQLSDWPDADHDQPRIAVYPLLKRLSMAIATSALMGMKPGRDAEQVSREFLHAVNATLAVLRLDLWPTRFWRGQRARRWLGWRFRELLVQRRNEDAADLFDQIHRAYSAAGLSDQQTIDQTIFLMNAAHDNSTTALTAILYLLAKHLDWQERLRAISLRCHGDQLDLDGLDSLTEHGWVLMEALRMYPPLAVMPRVTLHETEVIGFRIPANSLVMVAPVYTHRMAELWTEPDQFDPERFSPGRTEHRRHPYAWTPFGGGAHACLGQHFASLEIRATLHQLLRRYRWTVPEGYTMPYRFLPIGRPRDGLPLRLERLDKARGLP